MVLPRFLWAHTHIRFRADEILAPYGAQLTWDVKAELMGKRMQSSTDYIQEYAFPHTNDS